MEGIEIPVQTRLTLPEVWAECGDFGAHRIRSQAGDQSFAETIPAEIGREGMNALLERLRDFLIRNAKVELLQG